MTQPQEAPKMSLADALAKVQVTAGDASLILDGLAAGYTDKSPTLHKAFQDAQSQLSSGTSTQTEHPSTSSHETHTTH